MPSIQTLSLSLAYLAATPLVHALGINCRGSFYCTFGKADAFSADNLRWFINSVDDAKSFANGDHIACVEGGICAFLQNTNGLKGAELKKLAPYIVEHGCTVCGSVPTDYPKSNDVKKGELTFNYVSKPKCDNGLC
ncbi:killer toxin [Whalleya microplaca]|nr:killer toxin [Whalleya microplaca]